MCLAICLHISGMCPTAENTALRTISSPSTLAAGPTAAYAETKRLLTDGASRPLADSLAAGGAHSAV